MSDFSLPVGVQKTLVPVALDSAGAPTVYDKGTVFAWSSSDPNVVISDPAAQSPEIVGNAPATGPLPTGVTITLNTTPPAGSASVATSKSHTVDVVGPTPNPVANSDFTIQ